MKTFLLKKSVALVLCVMLVMTGCLAFAESEIASGYKGLNAVEANDYFNKTVIPAMIDACKDDSNARSVWEAAKILNIKVDTEIPSEKESNELHREMLGNISGQLKPYAVEKYKKAVAAEPAITKDILEVARSVGAGMYGLSYRLKSAGEDDKGTCRIEDKIQKTIDDEKKAGNEITYEQATDVFSDLIRYTVACSPFGFYKEYETIVTQLVKKGYKPVKVKNTWESYTEKRPYRGINCVFASPEKQLFEIQFHTAESYAAGQLTHSLYEAARKPGVYGTKVADVLNEIQYTIYNALTKPVDIGRIKNYPPKE